MARISTGARSWRSAGRYFFHLAGGTSTSLYWFDKNDGRLGGNFVVSGASGRFEPYPGQMVASPCGLFWWSLGGRGLNELALFSTESRAAVTVDRGAVAPRRLVVDGNWIFWTEKNAVGKMAIP